jgi:LPS sulfotransferase NodH
MGSGLTEPPAGGGRGRPAAVQRLFILAEPRSGSSWLMETLDSHPRIRLEGEILNHVQNPAIVPYVGGQEKEFHACLDYLEGVLNSSAGKRTQFHGCKMLLNQLTHIGRRFSSFFLDFYRDALFIFLYRANLVAGEISLQIARRHDVWHVKEKGKVVLRTVRLEPSVLIANLERSSRRRKRIRHELDSHGCRFFPLSYEELFQCPESTLSGIYAFLGISGGKAVLSGEMKGNPFSPRRVIENYLEVKAGLEPYPQFLEMLLAE